MCKFGFSHILGNEQSKKYLSQVALSSDVPQSIVITGEEGIGKLDLAEQFALALLCENPSENGACGECNSCLSYKSKQNPNINFWHPKGQNTTIDQMRALKENAIYPPLKGKYKINIIQKGDTLNDEASNSILKIIEEPPTYLINILLYNNPHNILQTIRSRSIVVNLNPVKSEIIENYISQNYDLPQDFVKFVSAYSMGSPGKAKYMAENEKREELRDLIFNVINSVINKPMEILYLADALGNKSNYFSDTGKLSMDEIKNDVKNSWNYPINCEISSGEAVLWAIDMISLMFRDMLLVKSGSEDNFINLDKKEEITFLSQKLSEEKIITAIHILWETKDKLKANINTSVALQAMLCKMLIELKRQ